MKKLTLSLLAACAVVTPAFAGVTVVTTKEYKQPVALPPPCFRDQEFTLDLFYSYNNGRHGGSGFDHHRHDNSTRSHRDEKSRYRDGSGGGVGLTFFFARYFGIGVEGNWWEGYETHSRRWDSNNNNNSNNRHNKTYNKSVAHQVTGNFIIRYPLEFSNVCLAPYIFGGGGGLFDGEKVGFGDAGAGLEWRATENFGIFADWRWVFTGKNKNDIDQTRAGIRFVF